MEPGKTPAGIRRLYNWFRKLLQWVKILWLYALRGSHNVRLLKCKTQIGLVSKRKNMKKKKKKKKKKIVSAN